MYIRANHKICKIITDYIKIKKCIFSDEYVIREKNYNFHPVLRYFWYKCSNKSYFKIYKVFLIFSLGWPRNDFSIYEFLNFCRQKF